ncbi:MAG TPA: four helix bundle protein [Terriglobia bacterium]
MDPLSSVCANLNKPDKPVLNHHFVHERASDRFGWHHKCSPQLMASNLTANTLKDRLVRFAVDIVRLTGQLPQNAKAKHIGNQILRSGTAAATNYGEARAAESRADFIHKLKICIKELNETAIWLKILQASVAVNSDFVRRLVAENTELCRILVASVKTARRNSSANPMRPKAKDGPVEN